MYHSDKDEELEMTAGKFTKKKFSKKIRNTEEENSFNYRNSHQSATEESTDFTNSFTKKTSIQDCIDLKNIVKSSVEGLNDLLNSKIFKISEGFEIINEEKEEEIRRPSSICPNIVVKKKTNFETKSERETPKSQIHNFNYTVYQASGVTKQKTRNLSAQKKLDSNISIQKKLNNNINQEVKKDLNTKHSSKTDLLEIGSKNNLIINKKNIVRKITDTKINSTLKPKTNTGNLIIEGSKDQINLNNSKILSVKKNIILNKENSLNINKKDEITKRQSLTSHTSKEKLKSENQTIKDKSEINITQIISAMKVYNDYAIDNSLLSNHMIINNILNNAFQESILINHENIHNIDNLTLENKKAIKIQRFWRKFKLKEKMNIRPNLPSSILNSYYKKDLINKLSINTNFISFINSMNGAIKQFNSILKNDHLQKLLALEKEIALKKLNKAEVKNDEGLNAQISKSIIKYENKAKPNNKITNIRKISNINKKESKPTGSLSEKHSANSKNVYSNNQISAYEYKKLQAKKNIK